MEKQIKMRTCNCGKKAGLVLIIMVVAIVLVAGGVYYWRQLEINTVNDEKVKVVESTKEELQKQIEALRKQVAQLQSQQVEVTETTDSKPVVKTKIEKALGYITAVYDKNGKRYLDIDYIQWLTGDDAKKAMVEDGLCENEADCVVTNDYHIKNQNPKIRTFEISPQAKIYTQTLDLETTGINWDQEITYDRFKGLFEADVIERQKYLPYHISIGDGIVYEVTEQYIP